MTTIVSTTKAREEFAEIISKVYYAGDRYIIEKQGKPVAMISAITDEYKSKLKGGNDFLLGLTKIKLKNGPKDLARNHDKYIWEE